MDGKSRTITRSTQPRGRLRPGLTGCCALLLLALHAPLGARAAEEEAAAGVSIYSGELDAETLPSAGQSMLIYAQLINTRDTSRPMKVLATIDGRVTTVRAHTSYLDKYDVPEYVFRVQAPRRELSYQFVLFPANEPAVFSDRYTVVRSCVHSAVPTAEVDPKLQGDERMLALLEHAAALERETKLYNEARESLARIKKLKAEVLK